MFKNKLIILSSILIIMVTIFFTGTKYDIYANTLFDNFSANSYIVMDNSGTILLEKNSKKRTEVASICKLMTTLITLEHIDNGSIDLEYQMVASEYASKAEGSQAFLDANQKYKVKDLLKSVIVASANDSAIVLAEGIAGSEENFVKMMNSRAKELNMKDTKYSNSTGLHYEEEYSTAYDTAILINKLSEYSIYQDYCKIWMDKLQHSSGRITDLVNTNRLIKYYDYCQTGKTGYTDEAGYCLSSTANKDNFKLTCVVLGCDKPADRFKESISLYNYVYSNYENAKIIDAKKLIDNDINVLLSNKKSIEIKAIKDWYHTKKKNSDEEIKINYELPKTIKAPIKSGEIIGNIIVEINNSKTSIPIVTNEDIDKQNLKDIFSKIISNFESFK